MIEPNAVFCRLVLSGFIITVVERVFALAAFSAVTLAIVIRSISFITPICLVFFSIAVSWVLAVNFSIDSFKLTSVLYCSVYVDNIVCFPDAHAGVYADVNVFMDAIYIDHLWRY